LSGWNSNELEECRVDDSPELRLIGGMATWIPHNSASRTGLFAVIITTSSLFALSGWIGTEPGAPVASRPDAYFQNDAGGRIADTVANSNNRAVVVHPLFYFVFTLPLHLLISAMAGLIPPEISAVYACRIYAAIAAGLGVGRLTAAIVRSGVAPGRVAVFAPLFLCGTSQTLVSLPDHFALSFGILTATFGIFLDECTGVGRNTTMKLIGLTILAGGITVTNVMFPVGLLVARWIARRGAVPKWAWLALAGILVGAGLFGWWISRFDQADKSNPLVWRVRGYLTGRVLSDPGGALARVFRGVVDPAVGPKPAIDDQNYFQLPMLTYEPSHTAYRVWPYNAVQSVGVGAWIGLLLLAVYLTQRDQTTRWPVVLLLGWIGANIVFHVLWGDEFFLYAPHYSWALATVVVLGLRRMAIGAVSLMVLLVVIGQLTTLADLREAVSRLPVQIRTAEPQH
jgi:hypothetical protein